MTRRRPPGSERVLLIGNYGNGNVGDDAILILMAPQALAHGTVTALSRHPARICDLAPEVVALPMLSVAALTAFLRSDTVVIGGGGMFGRSLPPLVALLPFVLLAACHLGKDVELRAVGAYPDMPIPVGWALRKVALRARHASARDVASVEALGGSDQVTLVRDPAWDLPAADPEQVEAVLTAAGVEGTSPLIAVSLKPGPGEPTLHRCVANMAAGLDRWAADHDGQIVFLPFSDKGDYQLGADLTDDHLGRLLVSSMVHGHRVRLIAPGLHPTIMRGIVGRCAAVVAMRLHAQIFAASAGRPVFGLSFEWKCDEFLASVGVAAVRPGEFSADQLGTWLDEAVPRSSSRQHSGQP
ncbi:MAG: polysaccharide pyruvyl transferase family protein [Acidimicrobiales bacterium]